MHLGRLMECCASGWRWGMTYTRRGPRKQVIAVTVLLGMALVVYYYVLLSSGPVTTATATAFPVVVVSWLGEYNVEGVQSNLPTLYVITPTYRRPEQIPELTRLGQTLMHVPKLHWLVAEDATTINQPVVDYLKSLGIPFTYILTPMPQKYSSRWFGYIPKGVANRNGAMQWLRLHAKEGVMYLADDDNTYDIRIFQEIRRTKKVSMFPVGLVTHTGLSTPVLRDGRWVGWFDGWIADRAFPVDMAGFAVSIPYLLSVPEAEMPYLAGYEETGFLNNLHVTIDDIEFLADNCTKIYVWHTQTQKSKASSRDIMDKKYDGTNLRHLQEAMVVK